MLLDNEHVPLVGPHLDGWANVIFQPLCKPIYVFHKSSKTGNFFQMAPWRVLGKDECGALTRAAAKHTPRKNSRTSTKNQIESAAGGAVPAEPLGDRLRVSRRA